MACGTPLHTVSPRNLFEEQLLTSYMLMSVCRYELHVSQIRLLDFYGGAADLEPHEYFAANVSCSIAGDMHIV